LQELLEDENGEYGIFKIQKAATKQNKTKIRRKELATPCI